MRMTRPSFLPYAETRTTPRLLSSDPFAVCLTTSSLGFLRPPLFRAARSAKYRHTAPPGELSSPFPILINKVAGTAPTLFKDHFSHSTLSEMPSSLIFFFYGIPARVSLEAQPFFNVFLPDICFNTSTSWRMEFPRVIKSLFTGWIRVRRYFSTCFPPFSFVTIPPPLPSLRPSRMPPLFL